MLAAFHIAGFEAWDVNMRDLLLSSEQPGAISLDGFRGIAWVGGFSYADVNDSAKGWAGAIRFNEKLLCQFEVRSFAHTIFSHKQPHNHVILTSLFFVRIAHRAFVRVLIRLALVFVMGVN